jgi:molybdopterin molybdotransferase
VGLASLPVYRRLKVAIFSTGDELVAPGQPLQPGQIYNSNRYTLTGLLQNIQCEIIDLGNVADDMASTLEVLQQAADQADLIVTSGGVSVGEEDYIKAALEQLGQVEMWRVAMKPGKPLAYGHVGETPFIGLPGNPVSVFATFLLFARPYLLRSMGASQVRTTRMKVTADFDWQRAGPRREFVRARLGHDAQGRPSASIYPSQSSGVMTSTVWADGLVIIPENTTISAGDSVDYLSFDSLLA